MEVVTLARNWKACWRDTAPPSFHSRSHLFLRCGLNGTISRTVCFTHRWPQFPMSCVLNVVATDTHLLHRCAIHMAITVLRLISCFRTSVLLYQCSSLRVIVFFALTCNFCNAWRQTSTVKTYSWRSSAILTLEVQFLHCQKKYVLQCKKLLCFAYFRQHLGGV